MTASIPVSYTHLDVYKRQALDLTEMQRYEMADSLCWIDDSLYVLGNKGVYSWKSGSEKMNTVIDLTAASNYDYVQEMCIRDRNEAERNGLHHAPW